jgi:TrmH family RNA methyltransferase
MRYPFIFYMVITSKSNPLIKKITALADKKFRKEYGEYLVEGTKPVTECIKAGCNVEQVVCTQELSGLFEGAAVVPDELFKYISSEKTPQGVIAIVKLPELKVKKPEGCCLLLDKLQDPGNLGTIIRTANAAGITDIYLINCTDAFSPKAVRASMSGIFFVNIYVGDLKEVFSAIGDMPVIIADMNGEDIFAFKAPKKFCLCIGNEGNGISAEVRARADYSVKIPMRESCESLNAAISAAISMYTLKASLKI